MASLMWKHTGGAMDYMDMYHCSIVTTTYEYAWFNVMWQHGDATLVLFPAPHPVFLLFSLNEQL